MTFGKTLSEARKGAGLSQKELAALILKEDGEPISPQYLNDLERDRRNRPSDHIMKQLSKVLKIDLDILYACAEEFPPDLRGNKIEMSDFVAVFKSLRRSKKKT